MTNYDPFQNYQTPGAYSGGVTPFGLPYQAFQSPIGGYGIYPQHLQGGGIPGQQQSPWQQLLALNPLAGLQNPLLQNPLLQNPLQQNPLLQNPFAQNPYSQYQQMQSPWQNPLLALGQFNPTLAYHGWPQQQQQIGYPLAPQSPIGGGMGQPFGQIHPLAHLALRQAGYGISPFMGGF